MTTFELDDNLVILHEGILELFVRGVGGGPRMHLRQMSLHDLGEDRHGRTKFHFAPGPEPVNGFRLEVPPERREEFDKFVKQLQLARDVLVRAYS